MKETVLEINVRDSLRKNKVKALRPTGLIPGVLYGGKLDPVPISIEEKDVVRALHKGHFFSKMVKARHEGKEQSVLVKEVQFHPVTDRPLHLDLFRVEENTVITVEIPVRFLNEETSPGLKRGGALNIVRHSIEVHCPAGQIPDYIDIDLAEAEIGDSIHISSITLPKGVELAITDRDFTVVTLAGTRAGLEDEDEAGEGEEEETPEEEKKEHSED